MPLTSYSNKYCSIEGKIEVSDKTMSKREIICSELFTCQMMFMHRLLVNGLANLWQETMCWNEASVLLQYMG